MLERRPVPPARHFPLVLRREWSCDIPNPRLGRKRALANLAAAQPTARPKPWRAFNDARG